MAQFGLDENCCCCPNRLFCDSAVALLLVLTFVCLQVLLYTYDSTNTSTEQSQSTATGSANSSKRSSINSISSISSASIVFNDGLHPATAALLRSAASSAPSTPPRKCPSTHSSTSTSITSSPLKMSHCTETRAVTSPNDNDDKVRIIVTATATKTASQVSPVKMSKQVSLFCFVLFFFSLSLCSLSNTWFPFHLCFSRTCMTRTTRTGHPCNQV